MEPIPAPKQPTQSVANTPEEKIHRRRVRRWKRRARIAGPFVAVTILLAALSLSVDLIEYQPRETPSHLSDRPIRLSARPTSQRPYGAPSIAVRSATSNLAKRDPRIGPDLRALDLSLTATRVAGAPTPPDALR